MRLFRQTRPDAHVAFRLPIGLLTTIDNVCESQDLTRSQFLRRSIAEYLKAYRTKTPQRAHDEWSTSEIINDQTRKNQL